MKKKRISILTIIGILFSTQVYSQTRKCATIHHLEKSLSNNPSLKSKMEESETNTQQWIATYIGQEKALSVITIPVVVHVLYNTTDQNISDAQIQTQLEVLNNDFRLLNSDSLPTSHPFWSSTVDTQIEFCLAKQDPSGAATDGITRTHTDSLAFSREGSEKSSATGGMDNWDPTKYLNIWVADLGYSGGTLGYATFPSELDSSPELDGVVITTSAFGTGTTVLAPNHLGRTATHEVGHWLNLSHIWGDDICGDDFVADTKAAEEENYDCPSFPLRPNNTCGSDADGEMYMNYMDYVDDECMNMFTLGQGNRMRAAINLERVDLITSIGCTPLTTPTSIVTVDKLQASDISIFPNPGNGTFTINSKNIFAESININFLSLIGVQLKQFDNIQTLPFQMNVNDLPNGAYIIELRAANSTISKEVFINK